jgi:hypothetical protein
MPLHAKIPRFFLAHKKMAKLFGSALVPFIILVSTCAEDIPVPINTSPYNPAIPNYPSPYTGIYHSPTPSPTVSHYVDKVSTETINILKV